MPVTRRRRWPRILGGLFLLLTLAVSLLMISMWSALGTKPSGDRLARLAASPQYQDGRFVNVLPTVHSGMSVSVLRDYLAGGSAYRQPKQALPVLGREAAEFEEGAPPMRVTWLGHSTFIIELDGLRALVDPVWGEHASPSALFGVKRFYDPPLPFEELPPVDVIVISHDHYDHLDEPTIRAFAERAGEPVPRFLVPLGVGAHLEYWGIASDRITEMDWWESVEVGGVMIVSTPARHFSGRFLTDRDATLWSGWAFLGQERRVYYSGDTAMTPQLTEIGERLGPFDLTLIEAGAYNQAWADVHLGPEQAVDAHRMVQGGVLVPIHWGLFDLALHGWTEPVERIRAAAAERGVPVAYPRPGESFSLDDLPTTPWWPQVPWETAEESPIVSSGLGE